MDENIKKLVRQVIKDDLGELVSKELEERFKPIQKQVDSVQNSLDLVSKQLTEDRKDINQTRIDTAKIAKATGVILEQQNIQEEKVVQAVREEAGKIPNKVEESVKDMFNKKPFLKKLLEKFGR